MDGAYNSPAPFYFAEALCVWIEEPEVVFIINIPLLKVDH